MSTSATTLGDVGEFAALESAVLPALAGVSHPTALWSDAATVLLPGSGVGLAISTDVAPLPASWHLGGPDWTTYGWYAVLANASDLAASGARPFAGVTSVEAPSDMLVEDLYAFFSGVAEAYAAFGMLSAGGNLGEADSFACHGTSVGSVEGDALGRSGAAPGDRIVVLGPTGRFAPALLRATEDGWTNISDSDRVAITRPRPQYDAMISLRQMVRVHAASDASDGLLGAVWNIASASRLTAVIDWDTVRIPASVSEASDHFQIEPMNLFQMWGDWQVVVAVAPSDMHIVTRAPGDMIDLGSFAEGPADLLVQSGGSLHSATLVRNVAFQGNSYSGDFQRHLNHMLRESILLTKVKE